MKKTLASLAVLALLVIPANANALRLFLAYEGVENNDPLGGVSPTLTVPFLPAGGGKLYVWAQVLGADSPQKYISISYNVRTTGTATVDASSTWNYTNFLSRWTVVDAGTLSGGELEGVRLSTDGGAVSFGVRDSNYLALDLQYDPATNATLVGSIHVGGIGTVFLEIGDIGIIRTGATWDNVYLGFGDENDGLMGDDTGMRSSLFDAFLGIPEPASLILLGLAGLAIRRRYVGA